MYKYELTVLGNGLKIASYAMPQANSVALGVWVAAGGRYENMKNKGISHFVEHLLFKRTGKRSAAVIKNSIEGIGGMLNGFTSEEVTCYLAKVTGKHLDLATDVLSDMVLDAVFDPRDIEKERLVILEEVKMYRDHPDQYVYELLGELLWPKQTLGIPLIGTFETINSLKRKDLVNYRDASYNPSNITIVACGNVRHGEFVRTCDKIFSKAKPRKFHSYEKMKLSQKDFKTSIFRKDTEQTHVAIGFHSISRKSPARYAMELLNIALGANMSSRLFHELREKRGLAYAISSHVRYYADGGVVTVEAGVDNKKMLKALELTLKELIKIRKAPITRKEFERAREYYQGHLAFLVEDTTDHMLWLGEKIVTQDEPIDMDAITDNVKKVKLEDTLALAEETFKRKNLNIAIVGPLGDKEKKRIGEIAEGF
ncbi:MAG: pitrilysin family protein [Candidatus Omnitrophica bacterium]|nr:pitrilysin family protein [Candidatus Omnitrophota bacterium]